MWTSVSPWSRDGGAPSRERGESSDAPPGFQTLNLQECTALDTAGAGGAGTKHA
jgi:hypothetical protein